MTDAGSRRFTPPWHVEEVPGGFRIVDALGARLCYVYAKDERSLDASGADLSWAEARQVAHGLAAYPERLRELDRLQVEVRVGRYEYFFGQAC